MRMKRILSLAMAALLMFSLAGCKLLDRLSPFIPNFGKVDTTPYYEDQNCVGVAVGNAVPCYSERDGDTIVMILDSGTNVKIYYREYIGEEDWVFTDHGWIYGEYVRTMATDIGSSDGLAGMIINRNVVAYEQSNSKSNIRTALEPNDRVTVYALTGAEGILWASTEYGWIPMQHIFLDKAPEPGCVPTEINRDIFIAGASGFDYTQVFPNGSGELFLTNIYEDNGILWAEIAHSSFTSLDFLVFPGGIQILLQDGTPYSPDPSRVMSGYLSGITFPDGSVPAIPGTPEDPGHQETPSQPETPTDKNEPTSPGSTAQPPKDTSLIGSWVHFDSDEFLARGSVDPTNWIFYADGTFYTGSCEYMYMYDQGGWYGASGGWGYGGNYFYDGNELVLDYNSFISDDPSEDGNYSSTELYSCSVSGNYATFGANTLYRADDINDAIRSCIQSNAASRVRSDLVGTWNGSNGTTLAMNDDGTFSENGSDGSYTGWFTCCGEYLYLVYQGRNGFIAMFDFTVGDGTLTCQTGSQWEYTTIQYTR